MDFLRVFMPFGEITPSSPAACLTSPSFSTSASRLRLSYPFGVNTMGRSLRKSSSLMNCASR